MSDSLWPYELYSPWNTYSPWNSPDQNTEMDSHSLLQGIFPTKGANTGLLHCRQILYQLSHQGSPFLGQDPTFPVSEYLFKVFPLPQKSSPHPSSGSNAVCPVRLVSATNSSMKLVFIPPTKCGFSFRSWNASRLYKVHQFWTLFDHRFSYTQLKTIFFSTLVYKMTVI